MIKSIQIINTCLTQASQILPLMLEMPMNDRTLITKNYLGLVISCMEKKGYDFQKFEISQERVQSYKDGQPDPKFILYVFRISSGVEKSYILDNNSNYLDALCEDLKARTFDSPQIL